MARPAPGRASARSARSSGRLLSALEQLLQAPLSTMAEALTHAATQLSVLLGADKVDVFLLQAQVPRLDAVGTSQTPLGQKQHELGLDKLPLANGGRIVQVFLTGKPFLDARVDRDLEELRGVREALGVRSQVAVPMDVGGHRRGVLSVTSTRPHDFTHADQLFLQSVGHWLGSLAHRAELVEQQNRQAAEGARQAVAEELLRVFAHDVTNHLFPLRTHLGLLKARARADGRGLDLRNAQQAEQALSLIHGMLSELMDVGRLEHGLLHVEPVAVSLAPLARQMAEVFSLPGVPIEVRVQADVTAMADPERLRQLLGNLLGNAVRHSPPGGTVHIRIRAAQRPDHSRVAVVEVQDEGPGIAADLLPHVFEKFSRTSSSPGLGLGLFLARGIAEQHGGSLEAETPPGQGALFRLTLPVMESGPAAARRRVRKR